MSQFTFDLQIILGSVIFTENKERAVSCCGLTSELFPEKNEKKKRKAKSSKKKKEIDQNNNNKEKKSKKMERKNSSGNGLSKMSRRFYSMGSQVNTSDVLIYSFILTLVFVWK